MCGKVKGKKMATEHCRNKSRNGFIITYFSVRSNKFKHLTPRKAEVKQCCGIVFFHACYTLCFVAHLFTWMFTLTFSFTHIYTKTHQTTTMLVQKYCICLVYEVGSATFHSISAILISYHVCIFTLTACDCDCHRDAT